ncbi:MAG: uroporphyrinogen-III C-methyltransferase [bacterium]
MKNGCVFLVGAGPGDPELITVKGQRLIKEADVLIYDYLANSKLIDLAAEGAEKIYVGKKADQHTLPQEEISALLVKKAKEGKKVVRLKGGDPFIFGRGGEEAEDCVREGVPFEIVPGVTSAIAVPAYAGIPLTHRDITSSVAFITGHERPDKDQSQIPWPELAKGPGTLVFLMGVKNLPFISKTLIEHGRSAKTPVAIIRWGTLHKQETVRADLQTIADVAKSHAIKPPAIIVIGEVVNLRETLNWFENKPLFGKRIINTRSRAQASQLTVILESFGAEVIEFPTIQISPIPNNKAIDEAINRLGDYDWVIFTSVNGVKIFFDKLRGLGRDVRMFNNIKVGAIGPATSDKLRGFGILSDFIPEKYQAEDIVKGLLDMDCKKDMKVLIPRALKARDYLPDHLSQEGIHVDVVPLYETLLDDSHDKVRTEKLLKENQIDIITFTSSSTVKNFFMKISNREILDKSTVHFACIGPITADELSKQGYSAHIVPEQYTIPGLARSIADYYVK